MEKGKPVRSVLGRGLSSLISSAPVPVGPTAESASASRVVVPMPSRSNLAEDLNPTTNTEEVRFVSVDNIIPNKGQPRQLFGQSELDELAASIKAHGVLQPILVRPKEDKFEIVAGERRWRAAQIAALSSVPVIVKTLGDSDALQIALIENIQRQDLNPIEEAVVYQRLMEHFSLSQQEASEKVGKDRATIANAVRLLKLPGEVQDLIKTGELSSGHAKAILSIKESAAQLSLARKALKEELTVRELESLVSRATVLDSGHRAPPTASGPQTKSADSSYPDVLERLRRALGTKVILRHHKSGRGKIVVEYFSEQELDRLVEHIAR